MKTRKQLNEDLKDACYALAAYNENIARDYVSSGSVEAITHAIKNAELLRIFANKFETDVWAHEAFRYITD